MFLSELLFSSFSSHHHHASSFSCLLKGENSTAFDFSLSSVHIAFFCAYIRCVLCINWHGSCDFKQMELCQFISFTKPESVDQDIAWITLYAIFVIDQKRNRRGPDSFVNRNEFCTLAPAFYNPLSNSISVLSYSITIL